MKTLKYKLLNFYVQRRNVLGSFSPVTDLWLILRVDMACRCLKTGNENLGSGYKLQAIFFFQICNSLVSKPSSYSAYSWVISVVPSILIVLFAVRSCQKTQFRCKLIISGFVHLQESRWPRFKTFLLGNLLNGMSASWRGSSWCLVYGPACPLPSHASPLPEPRAQPGLSGVIPWKGMTEPQCLEMAALAAISSSKKRAH